MGETIDTTAVTEQEYAVLLKILRKQNLKQTEEALKREAGIKLVSAQGGNFRVNGDVIPTQYQQAYDRKSPTIFATTTIADPKQSAAVNNQTASEVNSADQTRLAYSPPRVDSTTSEEEDECNKTLPSPNDKSPSAQPSFPQTAMYFPSLFQPQLPMFYPYTAPLLNTRFPLLTMVPVTQQVTSTAAAMQMPTALSLPSTATTTVNKMTLTANTTTDLMIKNAMVMQQRALGSVSSTSSTCDSPFVPDTNDGDCQDTAEDQCNYTELRQFADDFKARRIRLGYTQGGVGLSLAEKGFCNFAQSTISRFEQMQLSHRNATTIKKILEKWLLEMENPHIQLSSSEKPNHRKRKRRIVFTPESKEMLENMFRCNPKPDRHVIEMLANELSLLPEEVRIWFCNKRQKERNGEKRDSLTSCVCSSPGSSGTDSRCSPSPLLPSNFTIEELSKSSTSSPASSVDVYSPVSSPQYQTLYSADDVPDVTTLATAAN